MSNHTAGHALSPARYAALAVSLKSRNIPLSEMDRVHDRSDRPERPLIHIYCDLRPDHAFVKPMAKNRSRLWSVARWHADNGNEHTRYDCCEGTLIDAVVQAIADNLARPPAKRGNPPRATPDPKYSDITGLTPGQRAELSQLLERRGIPQSEMDRVHNRNSDIPERPIAHIYCGDRPDRAFIKPVYEKRNDLWSIARDGNGDRTQYSLCEGTLMAAVAQAIADNLVTAPAD